MLGATDCELVPAVGGAGAGDAPCVASGVAVGMPSLAAHAAVPNTAVEEATANKAHSMRFFNDTSSSRDVE